MRKAWLSGLALLLLAYALLSHALMLHAGHRPWAVALLFGPLLAAVLVVAIRRRHGASVVGCLGLIALLTVVVVRGGVQDINRLYVMQHVGIHLLLCWTFAISLRRGAVPLISALAERVHGDVEAVEKAYTRRLTGVWALYFAGMASLSVAVYWAAPWAMWSVLANLVTPVAAIGLFVGEYLMRYRWHPEFKRASMLQALRAYHQASAANEVRP